MSTAPKKIKEPEVETGTDFAVRGDASELPTSWSWASFASITKNYDGKRIPVKQEDRARRKGPYPYYGASGIIDRVDDYLFDGHFLLIGEDGANLLARSTPIAFRAQGQFWVNNHAHILQTYGNMPLEYFESYINSIDLQEYVTGSAQPKLTQDAMNRIPVPVPPLAEQIRIVSKIEEIKEELGHVRGRIERTCTIIERFRQAVLAAACSGKLTEDWRRSVNIAAMGITEPMDGIDGEPLPDRWRLITVAEIADVKGGKRLPKGAQYVEATTSHAYIRVTDFQDMSVSVPDVKYIDEATHKKIGRYTISADDVYISIAGSIGKVGLIPQKLTGANLTENAAKLCNLRGVTKEYLTLVLNSSTSQDQIEGFVTSSGQPKLALFRIEKILIPAPPEQEQIEIVRRVGALFKLADAIEKRVAAAKLRAERLTQAVLAKAFRGELVPTEAELARREGREYEPATVLLEKIKKNRQAAAKPSRRVRSKM